MAAVVSFIVAIFVELAFPAIFDAITLLLSIAIPLVCIDPMATFVDASFGLLLAIQGLLVAPLVKMEGEYNISDKSKKGQTTRIR